MELNLAEMQAWKEWTAFESMVVERERGLRLKVLFKGLVSLLRSKELLKPKRTMVSLFCSFSLAMSALMPAMVHRMIGDPMPRGEMTLAGT